MDQLPQIPPEALAALLNRRKQLMMQEESMQSGTPYQPSPQPSMGMSMSQPQFSNYGHQPINPQQTQQLIELLRQRALSSPQPQPQQQLQPLPQQQLIR
jgi:hypothetical protein